MAIHLDHLIVPSRNRVLAARQLAEILDVPWTEQGAVGPFSPVFVSDSLTLDFDQWDDLANFPVQHYCFKVDAATFQATVSRLEAAGIAYRSTPHGPVDNQVNPAFGGSIIYWSVPDGHVWELLTVSYERQAHAILVDKSAV